MLPFDQVNLVAVLVATAGTMAVGMIWHSPKVFGNKWMELTKVSPDVAATTDMKAAMGKALVMNLVSVYVLALLLVMANPATLTDGIIFALLLTLVLPVPLLVDNHIWEHRASGLVWLTGGYNFVKAGVAVAILMSM